MVFIDHSNLWGHLPREARLGVTEYAKLIRVLFGPYRPAAHREGTPSRQKHAFIYAADQPRGELPKPHRRMIEGIAADQIEGAALRSALLSYDQERCKARLDAPGWLKLCTQERREPIEKMLDVSLATDLVRFACKDKYDVGILVAGDRDYIPAVNAVRRGERVTIINAFVRRTALTGVCDGFQDISATLGPN